MIGPISMAASGLTAAGTRLLGAASNLAHVSSVAAIEDQSGLYQPVHTVQQATAGGGVSARLERSWAPPVPTHSPFSPFADASGMVATPAIDVAAEMVNLSQSMAAFRANMAMVRTADEVTRTLLDVQA